LDNDIFAYDVFISHSSKDQQAARDLAKRFRESKLKVWFDEWEITPGDSIPYRIEVGLESSRVLVLCMSRHSFASDWAQLEASTFRFRDPLNKGRRFIPLRLDDAEVPGSLRQLLSVGWSELERDANYPRLLSACKPPPKRPSAKGQATKRVTATRAASPAAQPLISAYDFRTAQVVFGRYDGVLCAWSVGNSGTPIQREAVGHRGIIKSVRCDEADETVLTACTDRTVGLWRIADMVRIASFEGHSASVNAAIWTEGKVASCSDDGSIRIWNVETADVFVQLNGHTGPVTALVSHGHVLVSAGADRTVRIWSVASKRCIRVLEGHTGSVRSLDFSADGRRVLSGSDDNCVRVWDIVTGICENQFEGHTAEVLCLAWHRNQRVFLSGSGDRTIRAWDVESGRCLRVFDGHKHDVIAVRWNAEDSHATSGDSSGMLTWHVDAPVVTPPPSAIAAVDQSQISRQVQYTNAKVLLVGESGAGKTGLSRRLASDVWEPSHSTLGAWATQWALPKAAENGAEREIWLWDFGGQADQRLIHQLYMEETALAVLVFDGQKHDVFESLAQWDQDLSRASDRPFAKLLVAGRIDAGAVRAARADIDDFVAERGYKGFLETSARTNQGCGDLRNAIEASIDWDSIPWRSSPALFKRLKEEIVKLKDEGRVLMRVNELRDCLKLRISGEDNQFSDSQLKAVLSLLAGPGVVAELEFGGWVLFRPELINAYGQAVIQTMRADASELGCVSEDRVLRGDLVYHDFERIDPEDERFVLLAMQHRFLARGLCLREHGDNQALLVFPSYYKRHRPPLSGHPAIIVSYTFGGVIDDIYSTLVVRLNYTKPFSRQKLWQDAADFKTETGALIGLKLSRRHADAADRIEVYCEPAVLLADRIVFIRYIHEHLKSRATDVHRRRHYVCTCGTPVSDLNAAERRRNEGRGDIGCSYCDLRVQLVDELEKQYFTPLIEKKVRGLDEQADVELDNESKERVLVGEMISAVALAGQICREKSVSDHGIDMEIEFKDDEHRATGELLFLQLKSGDSYLRTTADNREVFGIKSERHADYWMRQKAPVMLVIRDSAGVIRWMEIRDYLRDKSAKAEKIIRQIEFNGEPFNVTTLMKWRGKLLSKAGHMKTRK
jgi:small GTP-binding protein